MWAQALFQAAFAMGYKNKMAAYVLALLGPLQRKGPYIVYGQFL